MNTEKPKFVAFVVFVCTTASFIAQISSFGNVSRRDAPSCPVAKQWIAKGIPSYGSQSKRAISGGWVANQSARKTLTTVLLQWFSPFVTRRERVKSATQPFLVSSRNAPPVGRKNGCVADYERVCHRRNGNLQILFYLQRNERIQEPIKFDGLLAYKLCQISTELINAGVPSYQV